MGQVLELPDHGVQSCPSFCHQFPSGKIAVLWVFVFPGPSQSLLSIRCWAPVRCPCDLHRPVLSPSGSQPPLPDCRCPPVWLVVCTEFPGHELSSRAGWQRF